VKYIRRVCRPALESEAERQEYIVNRRRWHLINTHAGFHTRASVCLLPPSPPTSLLSCAALTMALDSFFHNKIESMKLEIIQGQAVLRRLEAQRNDYNSRGTTLQLSRPTSY
jgi:hypothetical protein